MEEGTEIMEGTENGYAEVTLIVEGALEETLILGADDLILYSDGSAIEGYGLEKWLELLEADAKDKGFHAEVYMLEHEHPMYVGDDADEYEDICAQYLTDHHPMVTFGAEQNA